MNPLVLMGSLSLVLVGLGGLFSLPPEGDLQPATHYVDPWADLPPLEASQRPLEASTSVPDAPIGLCPPIYALALEEGFTAQGAELLDRIAWHESRCMTTAVGDLDRGVSFGILQIHTRTWCKPSRYWPSGYLQAALILERCEELFDPRIAVRAARAIVDHAGFEAWSTYEKARLP